MDYRSLVVGRDLDIISLTLCEYNHWLASSLLTASLRFTDSIVTNSTNGLRIKTDYNATGSVVNVTYSNIQLSNIKTYGIDIQQDYLNGGPSGKASNGVKVANISFSNISGWVVPKAADYYIFCGDGSCEDFTFDNVRISGGTNTSRCNYPAEGCPVP